jgi:hypothetical protein
MSYEQMILTVADNGTINNVWCVRNRSNS